MAGNYFTSRLVGINSRPPSRLISRLPGTSEWTEVDEPLLLDLYCAEKIKVAPGGLSLRKVWTGFDPYIRTPRRGYYVVRSQGQRLRCLHFSLTAYESALACFKAVRVHRFGFVP